MEHQIRYLDNDTEFKALDSLYQMCFGTHSVPTTRQREWWLAAPTHIIALFCSNQVQGGISFWSISEEVFEKLSSGQLKEKDITISDFEKKHKQLYYFSDIAIAEQYRQRQYANLLLSHTFKQINNNTNEEFPIKILAFAFSEGGKKILSRLGFEQIRSSKETLDEQDLMLLIIKDKDTIDILINQLR